jgi:hypothetical protein
VSKQKPKLSEALQTSLSSLQEAWKDWENIPATGEAAVSNRDPKKEELKKDAGQLFEKLKDQLDRLS